MCVRLDGFAIARFNEGVAARQDDHIRCDSDKIIDSFGYQLCIMTVCLISRIYI